MLKVLFVLSLLLLISGSVQSQAGNTLVGTWKLVSVSSSTANGERNSVPYGARPTGILIYTREGTMAVVISYGERKSLSVVDRAIAPMKEKAEAFATFFAYSGRYGIVG